MICCSVAFLWPTLTSAPRGRRRRRGQGGPSLACGGWSARYSLSRNLLLTLRPLNCFPKVSKTNQLVFLRDRAGSFKMRDDIKSICYLERQHQYRVLFRKGENYLYYNESNVDVALFTRQLDPPFRIIRRLDGDVFSHVLGVRVFEGNAQIVNLSSSWHNKI